MTEYKTDEALKYYGNKVSYITFEKDFGCEDDNDIAVYINLYDVNNKVLNSYESFRVSDEDRADKKINRRANEYKELGYQVRF